MKYVVPILKKPTREEAEALIRELRKPIHVPLADWMVCSEKFAEYFNEALEDLKTKNKKKGN